MIADKLTVSQILLLLKDRPLSTNDISIQLGLDPSDVSRHMNSSSRHGLVQYDMENNRYELNTA